jgi:hypothetical protein
MLCVMAQGASNTGIARRILVTESAVEKHVRSTSTCPRAAPALAGAGSVAFLDAR